MSRIVGSLFEGSPLLLLPLVALALFGGVFIAVVARLLVQGREHYEEHARVALADERVIGGPS